MRLLRIQIMPLLMSMWISPVVAQSPQDHSPSIFQNPLPSQSLPGSRIPSLNLQPQIPGMFSGAKDGRDRFQISPSVIRRKFNLFNPTPNALDAWQTPHGSLSRQQTIVAGNEGLCYAIRDYRFSRVTPESDAMKLSGSSTCEPAGQFHPKTVR
jgi:hypothetical protein